MTRDYWNRLRWVWIGALLAAWALRLPPLFQTPLHPDEALYGYWGLLIGRGRDPWLLRVPVYKPPLLPYVIAVSQLLFGETAVALRIPGLMAGLLTAPLAGALTHRLYGARWAGAAAAVSVALSPFAVVLSASAFPDSLMVALGLAACLAAVRNRPGWSGVLAGVSFAAKQTGLVWFPLAVLLRILDLRARDVRYRFPYFLAGHWAAVTAFVFGWDAARVLQGATSFWQVGVTGYGGLRLIWPQELWPRLRAWSSLMGNLFGSPVINGLLAVGIPFLMSVALLRCRRTRAALADVLLISFLLIYAVFHWLIAFPIWDRYLLPLVPILGVILGRIGWLAVSRLLFLASSWRKALTSLLLAALLAVPALQARAGRYPIAQERAVYEGIDDVIAFVAELPEGSVVYHHWLGWHYHYGLVDAPIYLAYWSDPAWVARDVEVFGDREPRYIAFPAWESSARVEHHLSAVGYTLDPVMSAPGSGKRPSFTLYHLVPSSN